MRRSNNSIRHEVIKILVNQYVKVLLEKGEDNWIPPMYEEDLYVPIGKIAEQLKITYLKLEVASIQAVRDNAYTEVTDSDNNACYTISSNTRLYHTEKIYLKQGRKIFLQPDFLKNLIVAVVAAGLSFLFTFLLQAKESKNQKLKDQKQDSIISKLKLQLENKKR